MPNSQRSSHASEICRLEWRPSRLLSALLISLGALASLAALASDMPRAMAWLVAAAALGHGLRLARREQGRPPRSIVWDGHASVVRIDGAAVPDATLQWRGPLAFMAWRDGNGRFRRLTFWPDVLRRVQRRELRLAAGG